MKKKKSSEVQENIYFLNALWRLAPLSDGQKHKPARPSGNRKRLGNHILEVLHFEGLWFCKLDINSSIYLFIYLFIY